MQYKVGSRRYKVCFLAFFSFLALAFLSWCSFSRSTPSDQTEIAGFLLSIPATFTGTNPALVENKQIIDKVLRAWKIDKTTWFDPTLLFTTSIIGPSLDYEQFYTVNMKKIALYVPGYSKGERELMVFSCKDEKVKGLRVTFSVKSGLLDDTNQYYFWQYQFVYWGSGFVLSYASDVEKERDDMKDTLTKISCK
jgi:hypothetical protein